MKDQFYVFNPLMDKPRKIYDNYADALKDAKELSIRNSAKLHVLKIVATCTTETKTHIEEEIPF